jgi:hypothetical protein
MTIVLVPALIAVSEALAAVTVIIFNHSVASVKFRPENKKTSRERARVQILGSETNKMIDIFHHELVCNLHSNRMKKSGIGDDRNKR